ncbi:MAG: hypothetical protein V7651_10325 [Hyphomonas oceanitis]|uniref:hypothetical protein n=1 Tax=Hyphomonas oceanitis TaxID=81033 RepID=UPI003003252F
MGKRHIYTFHIDALRPETLSMKELSKYLADLAELIGQEEAVHFDRVSAGSAELKWWPDTAVEDEVRARLEIVDDYINHRELHDVVLNLNKRLANDNATAVMLDPTAREVARFPGREFKQFKDVPAFWQEDRLQGRLIRIGGKDETIHAHIDMGGKVVTNISLSSSLAREIVRHFLGPTLALNGKARWQRNYLGEWKLLAFQVHSFDVLEDDRLETAMDEVGGFLSKSIGQDESLYKQNQGEGSEE